MDINEWIEVSILLILDVDSEGGDTLTTSNAIAVFQSFLFWMLIRKPQLSSPFAVKNTEFQSFLFWMLIRKAWRHGQYWPWRLGFNPSYSGCWFGSYGGGIQYHAACAVSILLILDVDSEGLCTLFCPILQFRFQSFLFWMLIRKDTELEFAQEMGIGFQSFLFWMLIRKLQANSKI